MIGWISGVIHDRLADRLIVETQGMGYEILVPQALIASMGNVGDSISLYIHTHVREDALSLFGFSTLREREFFLLLTSVSGVGPKTALALMSAVPTDRMVSAILMGEASALQQAPGIGRKTAERLVIELKDRLKPFELPFDGIAGSPLPVGSSRGDLLSALLNLGYRRPEVEAALSQVDISKIHSFDKIFKETLKVLAK